jgi:hypothetical protein
MGHPTSLLWFVWKATERVRTFASSSVSVARFQPTPMESADGARGVLLPRWIPRAAPGYSIGQDPRMRESIARASSHIWAGGEDAGIPEVSGAAVKDASQARGCGRLANQRSPLSDSI